MTIILLILGIIVFIHELGHFIFAKKAGVYVYEFSLGFGPKLFSFKRKNDETEYMVRLIPLGGYVSMAGEEDLDEDNKVPDDQRLCNKSWTRRLLVMVAGVINNFILGFVLLFIMGLIYGTTSTTNTLDSIPESGALYKAGARNGDVVTKINDKKVKNYDDIQTYLALVKEGDAININIKNKDGVENTYKVKPEEKFVSIYKIMIITIKSLFTGELGFDSLSGPVGIYNVVDTVKGSLQMILYLTAYLSINIGFMNLLPFPAFDGGRAFLLIIEKIKGSKVNPKFEATINSIGFVLLMALMVIITIKDIIKLF